MRNLELERRKMMECLVTQLFGPELGLGSRFGDWTVERLNDWTTGKFSSSLSVGILVFVLSWKWF